MVQVVPSDHPEELNAACRRGDIPADLAEIVLPDWKHVSNLRDDLKSPSPDVRTDAANELGSIKRRSAARLLGELSTLIISDPARRVRAAAAWSLTQWGDLAKPALAELIQATSDPEDSVRLWAVRAISRLPLSRGEVPAVLPALSTRLSDIDSDVRDAARQGVFLHTRRL